MKNVLKYMKLILGVSLILVASCTEDDDPDAGGGICDGFFNENHPEDAFEAVAAADYFEEYFTTDAFYDVTIDKTGDVSISSEKGEFSFTSDMITKCEHHDHESNILYEDDVLGNKLILQRDESGYQLVLSKSGEVGQATLNLSAPPDLSLLAERAGTYTVTSMSGTAEHSRMSVIIQSDGTIDFDDGIVYDAQSIEVIYDRLNCCDRIHLDMRDGSVLNLYWDDATHTQLERIEHSGGVWRFD